MGNSVTVIVNKNKVEVSRNGQLCVGAGWIRYEDNKCCICQKDSFCLGFDTYFSEYANIYICIDCLTYIIVNPNTFESKRLREKYIKDMDNLKVKENNVPKY